MRKTILFSDISIYRTMLTQLYLLEKRIFCYSMSYVLCRLSHQEMILRSYLIISFYLLCRAWRWLIRVETCGLWENKISFLGTFAKLRLCPSVRIEQLGSHWTDFHEILYLRVLRKSVEKIQVSLKPNKNYGFFAWRPLYIYDNISLNSS